MYKWTMAGILGIACLLGVGVLFTDINSRQGGAKQEVTAPKMPEAPMNAQAAETIYKQSCIACHGTDLEGKMGPNLQKIGGKMTDQQLFKLVQNGRGGMPAFKSSLKDEDIANVARWLAEKK
ncbi:MULTISPECIES: cytochrome c [Paenibacillus]|uniref:Cytochrome c n=1 Tax=Paenibacillus baimaensis TaxID=2982185 RepID=A0ABT2UEN2_9BACL|nr:MULTISPECIES: cytochrome c [unclassified Paenibacillus]MCU6793103.1 cytochrome c [Paenibacillus sp. WQ 127069]OMF09223.1 cytochrome C [Paenibacillus sp. FSL H7-0331]